MADPVTAAGAICAVVQVADKGVKATTGKSIVSHCKSAAKGLRNIVLQKAGEKASKEAQELLFNKREQAEFIKRLNSLEYLLDDVASNSATAADPSVVAELEALCSVLTGAARARLDANGRSATLTAIDQHMNSLTVALAANTNKTVQEIRQSVTKKSEREKCREHKDAQMAQLEIQLGAVEAEFFAKTRNSEVYKAEYHGETVVLKKIDQVGIPETKRKEMMKDFATELAIMVKLQSPRIVQVYGVVTTDSNWPGLVVEYCEGGDLRKTLDDYDTSIDEAQRRRWLSDIALGMAYLHSKSVEHRDLKSANVLLTQEGRAKVADFGLSKCEDLLTTTRSTQDGGGAAGTTAYMAPEFLNHDVFSEKSDVYSFAIVMWEIWDRGVPWGNLRTEQIITQVLVERIRPKIPEMPRDLRDLMVRAWAHEPADRPDFAELEEAVRVKWDPNTESVVKRQKEEIRTLRAALREAKEEIHALRRLVCGGWMAQCRLLCELGEDPVPAVDDDPSTPSRESLEDDEDYELEFSGGARMHPAALAGRFAGDISALDAATAQLAGGAAPDAEAAPYASALGETLLQMERASGCLRALAAIEVAPWTPAQLREQLDAAYGRLEDTSSRRGSVTRRATPTRRPANGTNSTSWVSVWNTGALGHRDEDAAAGERHELDVVGERLDASSMSPDDAAAAQAFA